MLVVKNPPANAGDSRDTGSIPGLGRSPGEGYDNPLQYSCLEKSVDRGTQWATDHRVAKSWTRLKQLSSQHTHICFISLFLSSFLPSFFLRPSSLFPPQLFISKVELIIKPSNSLRRDSDYKALSILSDVWVWYAFSKVRLLHLCNLFSETFSIVPWNEWINASSITVLMALVIVVW